MAELPRALSGIHPTIPLDSLDHVTPGELEREYVSRSRPVVLRGAMRGSALLSLTPDRVAALAPHREVPVASYRTGNPYEMKDRVVAKMAIMDYIAALRAPRPASDPYPYLVCSLARFFPELLPDASFAFLPDRDRQMDFDLLVGRDSVSGTHFHSQSHALVGQVFGRKVAVLHPPSQTPRLYAHPVVDPYYCHSRARLDEPERFPRLASARAAVVTLDPGDAIFVPARWWHTMLGIGETISTAYSWKTRRVRQRITRPLLRSVVGLLLEPTLHRLMWRLEG